jgi:glycosyltransferase involved in cell wall biosynthesis
MAIELAGSRSRLVGAPAVDQHAVERPHYAPLLPTSFSGVRVSVVVPALNEAENLPHVLPLIPAWVDEIILVDGNSTDDTVAVARQLCPDVQIVQQVGRGKGAALRTGFAAASGDIIVMLDADGSTSPAEIPGFVGALLAGADFAKGSRFLQGGGTADMSLFRQFGNGGLTWTVRLLFGGQFSDLCYGYNAFWRRVLPHLRLDCDGFEVETLMNIRALRAGLKVVEVPSFEAERVHGVGRLRAIPDGWRVLKTIFRERFRSMELPVPAEALILAAMPLELVDAPLLPVEPSAERAVGEP